MQRDELLSPIIRPNAFGDAEAIGKSASRVFERAEVLDGLRELTEDVLATLAPREKEIVKMRFGLDQSGIERTASEVGAHFRVTAGRVRQIEGKVLARLRHPSNSRRLRAFLDGTAEPVEDLPALDFAGLPGLLTQAVINCGDKVPDGQLVLVVAPAWFEIVRWLEKDPNAMFSISPRKWEEIIAGAYERTGFFDRVTLTKRSGDYGRDVIAEKSGWGSVRFIDQVKAYKVGHLVTAKEVRELGFVLLSDQGANKGIVTTTSDFAPRIADDPLIKPHMPNRIELVNGKQLIERLKDLAKKGSV
jgi:restriction system protein